MPLNRLVPSRWATTYMKFYNLTLLKKEELKTFDLPLVHDLETPEQVFNGYWPWFEGRGLSTGVMLQMDSDRRVLQGLLGSNFTPEQMNMVWDEKMVEYVKGKDIIYIHTHDESHIPYVEGFGPLDGFLRHQLLPTEFDLQYAEDVDGKGPVGHQSYIMGHLGVLRFWPTWSLEIFTTHLSESKRDIFLEQLRQYYEKLGLPMNPP